MTSPGDTRRKPKVSARLVNATYFFLSFLLFLPFLVQQILPQRESFPHERLQALSSHWLKDKSSGKIKYELGSGKKNEDLDFKPSIMYRLSFSLLVGSGTGKGSGFQSSVPKTIRWDIETTLDVYFRPLLERLSDLANFTVDSQVLYFSHLSRSKAALRKLQSKENRSENEIMELDLKSLQGFLSANSWNPESTMENDREVQLNFMLFLPDILNHGSAKTYQVFIRNETGDLVDNFLIPRWGGVCIFDMKEHLQERNSVDSIDSKVDGNASDDRKLPRQERLEISLHSSDLEIYMHKFAGQLERLMGIDFSERKFQESKTVWLHYYMDQAFETLGAISNLVANMTHMTVLKRVVDRVEASLDLLEQSLDMISTTNDVGSADIQQTLIKVRLAYQYAEEAFYDPTLIPQLYFPIDQLAATLAPLILPLIPPICMNFIREFKRYRNKLTETKVLKKEKLH